MKTVTEAVIYYTVHLLELAVSVSNPDAGRKVRFFVSPFSWNNSYGKKCA